jgi:Sec-independent protein translocase protein TatA
MPDLLVVLVIVLIAVVFWRGPKTLPKLGEALGRGVREARREATDITKARERPPTNPTDDRAGE